MTTPQQTPDYAKFIQHHLDTDQTGILTNAVPCGRGEIAVYTFNGKPVDFIMTMDPKAGPQFAALVINTVTDWAKEHGVNTPDHYIKGIVQIQGLSVNGAPLRVQIIEVDQNDAMRFQHHYFNHRMGPDYMSKMASFGSIWMVQLADAENRLPGEEGFDEECREVNFVYNYTQGNRPYKNELAAIEEDLGIGAKITKNDYPALNENYQDCYQRVMAIGQNHPEVLWIPGHIKRLAEMTQTADAAEIDAVLAVNDRLCEMLRYLDFN